MRHPTHYVTWKQTVPESHRIEKSVFQLTYLHFVCQCPKVPYLPYIEVVTRYKPTIL